MAWYWYVIIATVTVSLVAIIGYVLGQRSVPKDVDADKLLAAEKALHAEQLRAERTSKERVARAVEEMRRHQQEIDQWFSDHKEALDAKSKERFNALASDRAELDRTLDDLLGTGD